jgi:hypothetical protein
MQLRLQYVKKPTLNTVRLFSVKIALCDNRILCLYLVTAHGMTRSAYMSSQHMAWRVLLSLQNNIKVIFVHVQLSTFDAAQPPPSPRYAQYKYTM